MRYIKYAGIQIELSNLCLGGAYFGEKLKKEESFEILDLFVRRGGSFIDTANVYCRWIPGLSNCSEQILGQWLKSRGASHDVVIATKGGHYDLNKPEVSRVNEADIRNDLEESLRTLGLDRIDFYWLHRDDVCRPIEEIIDMLEKFRKEGKIGCYGLSNYTTQRLDEGKKYLESRGKEVDFAVSNQWSLARNNAGSNVNPDPTLVQVTDRQYEWHLENKVPLIPYSSTALGFFEKLDKAAAQKQNLPEAMASTYWNEVNLKIYKQLVRLREETGHSLQALSLAYLLNQPFPVFPIGGVRNISQLEEFVSASEIVLSVDVIKSLHLPLVN